MSEAQATKAKTKARREMGSHSQKAWIRFKRNRAALIGLVAVLFGTLLAIFAPTVAPYDPIKMDLAASRQTPSSQHLLGTDELGRDILSRIMYGFRISLTIGLVSVAVGLSFGVMLGAPSGYFGGWLDIAVMRVIDILMSFPTILLAIIVVTVLGPGLYNAMLAVGLAQVPLYSRLVRGLTLKLKSEDFVDAARALGANNSRIIFRHILPNCLSPLIVQATLNIASAILSAAVLGFLGLGAEPPTPEWGAMLSSGRLYMRVAPHISIFPGLAIMVTVLAFNLMGDGLRDALDPRMSRLKI
jgi:peptide/nickel transport system permease protein